MDDTREGNRVFTIPEETTIEHNRAQPWQKCRVNIGFGRSRQNRELRRRYILRTASGKKVMVPPTLFLGHPLHRFPKSNPGTGTQTHSSAFGDGQADERSDERKSAARGATSEEGVRLRWETRRRETRRGQGILRKKRERSRENRVKAMC